MNAMEQQQAIAYQGQTHEPRRFPLTLKLKLYIHHNDRVYHDCDVIIKKMVPEHATIADIFNNSIALWHETHLPIECIFIQQDQLRPVTGQNRIIDLINPTNHNRQILNFRIVYALHNT
ncbi:MAG: hypothetical protein UU47_C0030G0002 [candidate division TM6 bacterium GW2011_GWE2_41_16]|nr:MAG: hypothetical protein UU47_C0030G0002 [candidate division TM6 bacterium GW2011_GWE2_41_16]